MCYHKWPDSIVPPIETMGVRRRFGLTLAILCFALAVFAPAIALAINPPVTFPDSALNTVVRTAIGKPIGQIYASDLTTLTSLSAESKGITHLDGLQYATSLTYLDLDLNNVTTCTPVSALTKLAYLDLSSNHISDIAPVSGLTTLTVLGLNRDSIASITPVAGLTKLTNLGLFWNNITDITPVSGLTNLTKLDLGYNPIASITPVAGLTKLTYLELENNNITDIALLGGLTNLTKLDVADNHITGIAPLSALTKLNSLELYYNDINDVTPLSGLTKLTYLELESNHINDVTPLSGLTNLTQLYLADNQIWDIIALHNLPLATADVHGNWLDLTPGSEASQTIDTWLGNGASVTWLPQDVGGRLKGMVRTLGGTVLGGAKVTLSFGPTALTVPAGAYLLPVVPTGGQTITFSKPYYQSYSTQITVSPGTTYTVDAVLAPQQLPLTMQRSPSGSAVSYKRKKGVARFTLAVTLSDARGAVAGKTVRLQKSSNGKKWSNLYELTTGGSGKVSKAFSAKKKGTTYYRWSATATAFDRAGVTLKQKVVVK